MPLVSATFQAELVGIFEVGPSGNPSGKLVGMDISKAYMNYISAGMNAGGFPFSAMPGVSGLGSALGDILDKESKSGALTAQKMAKEFDSCLQTFLSVNQTTIITTAGLGPLISELVDLLSKNNDLQINDLYFIMKINSLNIILNWGLKRGLEYFYGNFNK